MSQLIRIRQRLKAVATIKKITSAMRLIARSAMTQLHSRVEKMDDYHQQIKELLTIVAPRAVHVHSYLLPQVSVPENKLYICVGAQKGLCGNFNSQFNYWLYKNKVLLTSPTITLMAVGKTTTDFMKRKGYSVTRTLGLLAPQTVVTLTHEIINTIKTAPQPYSHVVLVSSKSKNFFAHEFTEHLIVPLVEHEEKESAHTESFTFEQTPEVILEKLLESYSYNIIYMKLLSSLLAEQNARFIAMDGATRNANQFLDAMKREYNKLRQAKITKELTELTAHFQN